MRGFVISIAVAVSAAMCGNVAWARERSPVVVELFTAQGCSGCPKANLLLDTYAARKRVVALTFPVDYWDYLGWRDTFAKPAFTDRQRAYADRLKVRSLNTPEFVVDGAREASSPDAAKIDHLIEAQDATQGAPPRLHILRRGTRLKVGAGLKPVHGGDVWLVRYDPALQEVQVKTGDNKGKVILERNIVEQLDRLGSWSGRPRTYVLPEASTPGLKSVILVQQARGGRIIAASPVF